MIQGTTLIHPVRLIGIIPGPEVDPLHLILLHDMAEHGGGQHGSGGMPVLSGIVRELVNGCHVVLDEPDLRGRDPAVHRGEADANGFPHRHFTQQGRGALRGFPACLINPLIGRPVVRIEVRRDPRGNEAGAAGNGVPQARGPGPPIAFPAIDRDAPVRAFFANVGKPARRAKGTHDRPRVGNRP